MEAKNVPIPGQLSSAERELLTNAILRAPKPPKVVLEVGTWLGGGSTVYILRALQQLGEGHLWGIEADRSVFDRMIANIRSAAPDALDRFTPMFGLSQRVIPPWLREQGEAFQIDLAFLDGGDNPLEQITEFKLLDPHIPPGGQLLAHDARVRQGKWFVPYLASLDNWESQVYDLSEVGLVWAKKIGAQPSPDSRRRARACLWKVRMEPAEVAAACLPRQVNALVLRLLPERVSRSLFSGRRK